MLQIFKTPKRIFANMKPWVFPAIEKLADILSTSPYYFPEYTIHGKLHVEKLLEYADKLIPSTIFLKLIKTDISVSVLVLGLLLHDVGMFIKEDGFIKLLCTADKLLYDNESRELKSWNDAWKKHITWLKRASRQELNDIYGTSERVFDESNKLTVGAFLRRYHHEIAYYISIYGFPGKNNNVILNGIDKDVCMLIGILAKSHGLPMRNVSKDIDSFGYKSNKPKHIPIYYLMAVLRLADLLDADVQRAPKIIFDMTSFASPKSEMEWTLNQLINDRQWAEETNVPETLHIISKPGSTTQYLELKSWFEYWQKELDLSWAVLGEMHGDEYKLTTRRITTNLDDDKFGFITKDTSLRINPEILKLLVRPLYNNNPSYGVRELISNAIDACREREILDPDYSGKAEVFCIIDTYSKTLSIIDNGIGMTDDVIVNYFLHVGASYKNSDIWKNNFTDENGISKVPRIGRFGIGILAGYLLGDYIEVTTRNMNDKYGYKFSLGLDDETPDIKKIDCNIGTTISIKIPELMPASSEEQMSFLFSDFHIYTFALPHYAFSYPPCYYIIQDKNKSIFSHEILYYRNDKPLEVKYSDSFAISIGSLLDIDNFVISGQSKSDSGAFVRRSIKFESGKLYKKYIDLFHYEYDILDRPSYLRFGPSESPKTEKCTHARIEKMFYNGMVLKLDTKIRDTNKFISNKDCKPLYINIEDYNFSTPLSLNKDQVLDGNTLREIYNLNSFFLMMYPLTVDEEQIRELMRYDRWSHTPHYLMLNNEKTSHKVEQITPVIDVVVDNSDVFLYTANDCLDKNEDNWIYSDISEAMKKWLVVSPGYEQNYEIPYNLPARKQKFQKAFFELEKYID